MKLYHWDKWFARRRFTIRRGEHYRCSQSSMSQQVRNAAAARGLRVSLVDGDGQLTVLVLAAPDRPEQKAQTAVWNLFDGTALS